MELSELELINEYNNCYFISLINVLNGITDSEKIGKYELNNRIADAVGDSQEYFSGKIADEVFDKCSLLFDITPDKSFRSRTGVPIPTCFSVIERIYIKSMVKSKYGKLFLSSKEAEEIIASLGDVPDVPINDYLVSLPSRTYNYNDKYISNFRFLLMAIKENKEISYSNKTKTAVHENKQGYPIRIEYSALYDLFQLSLWSSEENRPVKINIHSMYDISFTGNIWSEKKSPVEMMMTKRCNEPAVIEFNAENNTLERVNILFSMYNTETEQLGNGTYRKKLYYYYFDEDEIINSILSFGPYVKVISPTVIVEKIKERISCIKNGVDFW